MIEKIVSRLLAGVLLFSGVPGSSQATNNQQAFINFLEKENGFGPFPTDEEARNGSRAYVWSVSFESELRTPLDLISNFCTSQGGTILILIPAGQVREWNSKAKVELFGKKLEVTHEDIWSWEGQESGGAGRVGFNAVFPRGLSSYPVRLKAVSDADANPPMGLFACGEASATGPLRWAATIMPGTNAGRHRLFVSVRPVTQQLLEKTRVRGEQAAQREREVQDKLDAERREQLAAQQRELTRLAPFRSSLTIGSQTNCGLVINDRGAVVEVQLPSGVTGPAGQRQFWIKRRELADYPFPNGCNFGQ